MSYFPNIEAVRFFTDAIWPLVREAVPEARFTIVGRNPDPSLRALADADPGISVTGTVPDIRPYIEQATLYVCPVQTGAGIKNKVLEAMAMQRPIVATSFACTGIDVRSGVHMLLRDDPEEFAAAVIGLLRDPAQRARLGRSARQMVEQQYGWTANAQHVESLYYQAVRQ
jgi:glycosyltransferase involved in cell wall biosynthesis